MALSAIYKTAQREYNYYTVCIFCEVIMERSFPVILCELRKEKGLSQKEAASMLGVSQALLSHYEKGIRECGRNFLIKAAELYGVTCDYLLGCSTSKTGFNEVFDMSTASEEDKRFSTLTAFRAISSLQEVLVKSGTITNHDYNLYYSLIIYRLVLFSVINGALPKDWLPFNIDNYNTDLTMRVMDTMCLSLVKDLADVEKTIDMPVPESIKTIIEHADGYLKNILQNQVPTFHE